MSEKTFQKKSIEQIFPQKEFNCTRCDRDLLKTQVLDTKRRAWVKKDRSYTYYKGKLVCMRCYHEREIFGI